MAHNFLIHLTNPLLLILSSPRSLILDPRSRQSCDEVAGFFRISSSTKLKISLFNWVLPGPTQHRKRACLYIQHSFHSYSQRNKLEFCFSNSQPSIRQIQKTTHKRNRNTQKIQTTSPYHWPEFLYLTPTLKSESRSPTFNISFPAVLFQSSFVADTSQPQLHL